MSHTVRCTNPRAHGVGFHVSGSKAARECAGESTRLPGTAHQQVPDVKAAAPRKYRISARRLIGSEAIKGLDSPKVSHEVIGSSPALVVSLGPRNDLVLVRDPDHTFVTFRDDTDDWMDDYAERGISGYDSVIVEAVDGGIMLSGGQFDWALRQSPVDAEHPGDVIVSAEDIKDAASVYRMSKSDVIDECGTQPNWMYEDGAGDIRCALFPVMAKLQESPEVTSWLRGT